jgi:Tfp pilus assembly protein PilO
MRIVQGDGVSTGMAVTAVALMAAAVGYYLFVPAPKVTAKRVSVATQRHKIMHDAEKAKAQVDSLRAEPLAHVWTERPEKVMPQVLARLNALGKSAHVTVNGFRPQKEQAAGEVQILPFFLTLQGNVDGISRFLENLNDHEPKIALSMIQIATAETGNAPATASLNVVAYLQPPDDSQDDSPSPEATKKTNNLGAHSGSVKTETKSVTGPTENPSKSTKGPGAAAAGAKSAGVESHG